MARKYFSLLGKKIVLSSHQQLQGMLRDIMVDFQHNLDLESERMALKTHKVHEKGFGRKQLVNMTRNRSGKLISVSLLPVSSY